MATIPNQGTELRHVRKTVTFTGGANAGATGVNTIFTTTGAVEIVQFFVRCTTDLVDAVDGALFTLGVTNYDTMFGAWTDAFDLDLLDAGTGLYYDNNYGYSSGSATNLAATVGGVHFPNPAVFEDIIMTISGQNITGGVLVFDVIYRPLSDDGALAGDDIDESWRDHFWGKAMTELSAVPAITASAFDAVRWLFTLARNKITQTSTTQTLRNDADNASIATSTVGDDGTTFTRGEWN